MTVFITLTIIIFAFIPHKKEYKFLWYFLMFMFGVFLVLSRVAVGAHFPLDIYAGTAIGYIVGLLGIFINRKYDLWAG